MGSGLYSADLLNVRDEYNFNLNIMNNSVFSGISQDEKNSKLLESFLKKLNKVGKESYLKTF